LDGIVFTGGADVSPAFYGETPHPATYLRPARDDAEMTLLRGAVDRDMPVLAICRGMQLLTVAYGGRLHQHLPDVLGNDSHRPAAAGYGSHDVRLAAGSACAAMLGERTTVNSLHHQGIADVGSLTATGWAIDNQSPGNGGPDKVGSGSAGVVGSGLAGVTGSGSAGVVGSGSAGVVGSGPAGLVEAVEDPSKSFVVGVQWHPEQMTDWRLFAGFIRAVRESLDRVRGAAASDPEPAVS
jgi:putative glutamine amidotransferase